MSAKSGVDLQRPVQLFYIKDHEYNFQIKKHGLVKWHFDIKIKYLDINKKFRIDVEHKLKTFDKMSSTIRRAPRKHYSSYYWFIFLFLESSSLSNLTPQYPHIGLVSVQLCYLRLDLSPIKQPPSQLKIGYCFAYMIQSCSNTNGPAPPSFPSSFPTFNCKQFPLRVSCSPLVNKLIDEPIFESFDPVT